MTINLKKWTTCRSGPPNPRPAKRPRLRPTELGRRKVWRPVRKPKNLQSERLSEQAHEHRRVYRHYRTCTSPAPLDRRPLKQYHCRRHLDAGERLTTRFVKRDDATRMQIIVFVADANRAAYFSTHLSFILIEYEIFFVSSLYRNHKYIIY